MTVFSAESFDVAVIGAGHAGIEAALAAARLGAKTACFSINLDAVGNMPCNPAIGGTAKGHLVREIDALGGEMARAADAACIQYRMLNRGKGPAVHSLRAQADRIKYREYMKHTLERQENLFLMQDEIVSVEVENGAVSAVVTAIGARHPVKAAVIASGTFLGGRVIIGEYTRESGPDGMAAAKPLTESLRGLGLRLQRFKTGTPPRINRRSINYTDLAEQAGEDEIIPFSFETDHPPDNRAVCYLTYTTAKTHEIIRANLSRSPLYGGQIEGVGPRYCPSIEDKIVKFADKERHQVFIEPEGLETNEMYIGGMSSSLPEDVQYKMYRSVPGLEHAKIVKNAYAIEYDCIDARQLHPTLEFKSIHGLFSGGQFNGSSGYEEAAAQGLIAGINAALEVLGREQLILDRSQAYIGVLIDDLVTKESHEPYRMMTSRAEYRLLLRQDNADQRLTEIGHKIGLISDERYQMLLDKEEIIRKEIHRLEHTNVGTSQEITDFLTNCGSTPLTSGSTLAELIKRPELNYELLEPIDHMRTESFSREIVEQIDINIKYEGYIKRQLKQVEQFKKLETRKIPADIDYDAVPSLRIEAVQKLKQFRPLSIGQASRISGVSPADISVLLVYLGH